MNTNTAKHPTNEGEAILYNVQRSMVVTVSQSANKKEANKTKQTNDGNDDNDEPNE